MGLALGVVGVWQQMKIGFFYTVKTRPHSSARTAARVREPGKPCQWPEPCAALQSEVKPPRSNILEPSRNVRNPLETVSFVAV